MGKQAFGGPGTGPGSDSRPRPMDERPLNPRQERFCQAYAGRLTAAAAARDAGYAAGVANKQGWRLMRDQRVQARIADIEAARARDRDDQPAALRAKLEAVYRHALARGNFHAAARAVDLQARLAVARETPALPPLTPPAPAAAGATPSPPPCEPAADPAPAPPRPMSNAEMKDSLRDHRRWSAEGHALALVRDEAWQIARAARVAMAREGLLWLDPTADVDAVDEYELVPDGDIMADYVDAEFWELPADDPLFS